SIAATPTRHWGGFVLLFGYVVSQMASSYFMMTTTDKTQRTLFMIMPLVFVFIIARFPAGLVLYWVTTNLWTVGQGLITRRLVAKTKPETGQKRSSRAAPKERNDGDVGVPAPAVAPNEERPQRTEPKGVKREKRARG